MIDVFRFSILGESDIPLLYGFIVIATFIVFMLGVSLRLLSKGIGIRN